MIHPVATLVRPAYQQPRHTNTINTINYERIKSDKDIRRDSALLLRNIAERIKENNETKVRTDEEAQDDFYTLNSHRFD